MFRLLQMFSCYIERCYEQPRTCLPTFLSSFTREWHFWTLAVLLQYHNFTFSTLPSFITMNKTKFYSTEAATSVSPFSPNVSRITPTLQLSAAPPKQKDWGRVTALLSNMKLSSESPSVWSQSFHNSTIEEVLILSTHPSSQSWRHLPKTRILLKILERHSTSKFLLLSAFHFSFHLYLLLQSSIHLPTSSHTLGIPVLSPHFYLSKSYSSSNSLSK